MKRSVILTGATGFLGTWIAACLLENKETKIYTVVRATTDTEAANRLTRLWWTNDVLRLSIGNRIIPIAGDITKENLGVNPERQRELIAEVTHIIHAAAAVGIKETEEVLWQVNVLGTRNVLEFAKRISTHHSLKRFSHVSTAYVAGSKQGNVYETDLSDNGFESLYERSKFEAECILDQYKNEYPLSVFRPGLIVGDSRSGEITSFNTLYYPLKLYMKNQLRMLPIRGAHRINLVPVDYVSSAVVKLTFNEDAAGLTFHLCAPYEKQPTAKMLINEVQSWAAAHLDEQMKHPLFMPLPFLGRMGRRYNLGHVKAQKRKSSISNMVALAPYFYDRHVFDTRNTERLLGSYPYEWKQLIDPLLSYAARKGFLNHNERTVFEQMQVRARSKRNPIRYYDVSGGQIKKMSADEVETLIEKVCASLSALGIGRGSRIATSGTNSTNYLVLDMAIGRIGAIHVPLYYTSPPCEIESLVKQSGSEVLFLGSQKLLERVAEIEIEAKIVSFFPYDEEKIIHEKVIAWTDFLRMGEMFQYPSYEQVCYDDIATIRYTSGTTGQPKGVMFNHYQLRWMGETLPSLLSWKTRNKPIRYLSFLPMSHVVEGILVSYAPYYILSNVEIYYLNEFDQLVATLPKVKPTIFFSVPRFYEKMWEQFVGMSVGKYYLSLPAGMYKRWLGKIMRFALLSKAGLNKCNQLIVGSAPVSSKLLESFRELGIEIYNAYGLTEAPLITLSRLWHNEIGSVGSLLPQTEANLTDNHEIIIRGPQVTVGYDGVEKLPTDEHGWFKTGDYGSFSDQGNVIIEGRKKETLITSYGKNINPQKIEISLKTIPSVAESLVVGDNYPYCSALLWVDIEEGKRPNFLQIDKAIEQMNKNLSHPEQIKKWAILSNSLSIAAGELTPNLKLRRNNIIKSHHAVIHSLYASNENLPKNVIHRGCVQ